jgi:predicted MFS family arabinose efflux permease
VTIFTINPIGVIGGLALFALGFLAFAQAVWNTSRVPRLAEPDYQARLQSMTSMAFTLGTPLGALWGGVVVDRFGLSALIAGAGVLAILSLTILVGGQDMVREEL